MSTTARVARWAGGVVLVILVVLHLWGILALPAAIRIGVAILGTVLLAVAARALPTTELDPRQDGDVPARRVPAFLGRLAFFGRRALRRGSPEGPGGGLEMAMRFSESSAMDFHRLLRPRLVAVANRRLADAGIDPSDRQAVEAVLGTTGASLVDPAARPPHDRQAAGVPVTTVRDLLSELDQLR